MIEYMVEKYFELMEYCKSNTFNQEHFKMLHKNYTDSYKLLERNKTHGELAAEINKRIALNPA